ncbi:MAG: SsrA-binding protein SmpB [Candidatus Sericytochromatia bacterium]|nr:SsrA-binding protein SmpB [Candidatus Sericytochromatia bacterium]
MSEKKNSKLISENRKAYHDYFVIERFEAGISLTGTEIKSIRMGQLNLKDNFARIEDGEVMLHNMHISTYAQGSRYNHEPLRTRKLLLRKKEIMRLLGKTREKGFSLVALKMYWSGDWAKIELGLVEGKKEYDKRDAIKERDGKREIARAIRKFV